MPKTMINVCIFEDDGYLDLLPHTYAKPAFDLFLGCSTLADKIKFFFKFANISLHCRQELKPIVQKRHRSHMINQLNTGAPCLFINGRTVMTTELAEILTSLDKTQNHLFLSEADFVAAYVKDDLLNFMKSALEHVPSSVELITYLRKKCVTKDLKTETLLSKPWQLITRNEEILSVDFKNHAQGGLIKGEVRPLVTLMQENQITIEKRAIVEDFVFIDATKGPVLIDEDAVIMAGSRLEGPLYIGKHSHCLGARLKSSSIGPHCKIGGEVSHSTFYGYSNKAHDGFVGHSYIGEWVNLGAGTIVSNLKSTYGTISLTTPQGKQDTGLQFLGALIGDHVKCGIATHLNAGTQVGFGSFLTGSEIHQNHINPFTWGKKGQYEAVNCDKFFEIANRMMNRRNHYLDEAEKNTVQTLYNASQQGSPTYNV